MKKTIALAVALIMALTLAACGGNTNPPSGGNSDTPGNTPDDSTNTPTPQQTQSPLPSTPDGGDTAQPPTPAEPGERGNTAGNLAYDGYAALKDDWIYYEAYGVLYKMRADGTDISVIDPGATLTNPIYIIGDWIYAHHSYGKYRFHTDGTGLSEIPLTEAPWATIINIVGDWIYYRFQKEGMILNVHRIRTDGTKDTFLFETENPMFVFVDVNDDWIYYYKEPGEGESYVTELKRASTDGSKVESMTIPSDWRAHRFQMDGEWLYFREGNSFFLYRMNISTLERELVHEEAVNRYLADGDWVYFDYVRYHDDATDDESHIYKIRTDGTALTKVTDYGVKDFNIVGDWIIHTLISETYETQAYYRIRTDGTGMEEVARYTPPPPAVPHGERIQSSFSAIGDDQGLRIVTLAVELVEKQPGMTTSDFTSLSLKILKDGVSVPFELQETIEISPSGTAYILHFKTPLTEPGTYTAEFTYGGYTHTSPSQTIQ